MVDRGRKSDKLYFRYKAIPRWDKDGNPVLIKKPVIEVVFRRFSEHRDTKENREIRILALIDSGADWSFIPLELAQTLRLDIDTSDSRILTVAGETDVFQTKVHVEIPRKGKLPIPVGMIHAHVMPHESADRTPEFVILGRKDFFEKFEVTINETNQTIILRDVHRGEVQNKKFKKK